MRYPYIYVLLILSLALGCDDKNAPIPVNDGGLRMQREKDPDPPPAKLSWEQQITFARQQKNLQFRQVADSPIPAAERSKFKELNYFPLDPAYRLMAQLEPYDKPETIQITTSSGGKDAYIRYGALKFKLNDIDCTLDVFKPQTSAPDQADRLFIPFKDLTSGKETYGAGRYLEVSENQGHTYQLDFNLAYNPYCAYSDSYSCPIPPAQNTLKVAIKAGEKRYHE